MLLPPFFDEMIINPNLLYGPTVVPLAYDECDKGFVDCVQSRAGEYCFWPSVAVGPVQFYDLRMKKKKKRFVVRVSHVVCIQHFWQHYNIYVFNRRYGNL